MDYDLKQMIEKVSKWSEVQDVARLRALGLLPIVSKVDANNIDLLEIFSTEHTVTLVDMARKAIMDLKTGLHDRELLDSHWLEGIGAEKLTDEQIAKLVFKETKIMLSKYREIKIELFKEFINSQTNNTCGEKKADLDQ